MAKFIKREFKLRAQINNNREVCFWWEVTVGKLPYKWPRPWMPWGIALAPSHEHGGMAIWTWETTPATIMDNFTWKSCHPEDAIAVVNRHKRMRLHQFHEMMDKAYAINRSPMGRELRYNKIVKADPARGINAQTKLCPARIVDHSIVDGNPHWDIIYEDEYAYDPDDPLSPESLMVRSTRDVGLEPVKTIRTAKAEVDRIRLPLKEDGGYC